jgi:DNA repair protein RecO (recombination protein O)
VYTTADALILRETQYREADKILTVLTPDEGKLTVTARAALRRGSALTAATQRLTYARLTLNRRRGRYAVQEAEVLESFQPLRRDLVRFAAAGYAAETVETVADEGMECRALFALALNTLYALGMGRYDTPLVKAAFEWRLMGLSGYEPMLDADTLCGEAERPDCCVLRGGASDALRYVLGCPAKRLFSFMLDRPEDRLRFCQTAEKYLLCHLDRGFPTLDFYHEVSRYA